MLIGGYGIGAAAGVASAARRSGLELVQDGDLALAAPAGVLATGDAGQCRVWLTGRAAVGLPAAPAGRGASAPAQAIATDLERLGDAFQADIRGAYLLVVLNRARQLVRVSHDHLGARTLSYARSGASTFFAEHIVDLLALLQVSPPPDRLALVQWIDSGTLPLGRSLFTGVTRVPGGHALEISRSEVAMRRFWRPNYREPVRTSRHETVARVAEAALAAIGRATDGLQTPAVKLSGGLDSACVAAGVTRHARRQALAFGCTFADFPETDETELIQQTASTTGLELVTIAYREALIVPAIRGYIDRWALPPGSLNLAIWPPLMAAARDRGVDGLLDGEGGDELFGAWPYLIADRLRSGRMRAAWRLTGKLPGVGEHAPRRLRLRALRSFGVSGSVPLWSQHVRRRLRDQREGFGPLVCDIDLPGLIAHEEQWTWKSGDGPLWWRSAVDSTINWPERLDASGYLARDAIDGGVEGRHPFFHDAGLLEAMLMVNPEEQFDSARDRPLLRDGLVGSIPETVRTRSVKSYFNELSTRALAGHEGSLMLEQVTSPTAPVRDYVRAEGLARLAELSGTRGPRRHQLAALLFRLASVDSWLRHLAGSAP